ncbi:hypothetical protein G7K_2676-t1 [Saitoella complicata NRRL Y-17804]|uniref:RGS domain-containing protein n=2 Tax=Saitoella complicata (strain BCRC 22490 / CBS 7301 / JCM 7358 / NBRC 10748 / NRRL Y-17804) TaxID=698492 RepID=A0A0E9NFB2_SAICN|nr:hypothetical protein G7K_2676-t1 [Saitoella complicata NRRL Y-17804]
MEGVSEETHIVTDDTRHAESRSMLFGGPLDLNPFGPFMHLPALEPSRDVDEYEDNAIGTMPDHPHLPTLTEVLRNTAEPPYTLAAFMAFLAKNHCLENLEFCMDASRYGQEFYSCAAAVLRVGCQESAQCKSIRAMWERILEIYITQNSAREVNLPANVRDALLECPKEPAPPAPENLDMAVRLTVDMMRDSVLGPFLVSASKGAEPPTDSWAYYSAEDRRRSSQTRHLSMQFEGPRCTPPASIRPAFSRTSSSTSRFSSSAPSRNAALWRFNDEKMPKSAPLTGEFALRDVGGCLLDGETATIKEYRDIWSSHTEHNHSTWPLESPSPPRDEEHESDEPTKKGKTDKWKTLLKKLGKK